MIICMCQCLGLCVGVWGCVCVCGLYVRGSMYGVGVGEVFMWVCMCGVYVGGYMCMCGVYVSACGLCQVSTLHVACMVCIWMHGVMWMYGVYMDAWHVRGCGVWMYEGM